MLNERSEDTSRSPDHREGEDFERSGLPSIVPSSNGVASDGSSKRINSTKALSLAVTVIINEHIEFLRSFTLSR